MSNEQKHEGENAPRKRLQIRVGFMLGVITYAATVLASFIGSDNALIVFAAPLVAIVTTLFLTRGEAFPGALQGLVIGALLALLANVLYERPPVRFALRSINNGAFIVEYFVWVGVGIGAAHRGYIGVGWAAIGSSVILLLLMIVYA